MAQSAEHRANEAERLINEPLLKMGFAALEAECIDELLMGPPADLADPDKWLRERVESLKIIRAIPQRIRAAFAEADAQLTRRGGVA